MKSSPALCAKWSELSTQFSDPSGIPALPRAWFPAHLHLPHKQPAPKLFSLNRPHRPPLRPSITILPITNITKIPQVLQNFIHSPITHSILLGCWLRRPWQIAVHKSITIIVGYWRGSLGQMRTPSWASLVTIISSQVQCLFERANLLVLTYNFS